MTRKPGIVLDTDALLAYAEATAPVGDRLAKLADLGWSVLIPAACLADAYRRVNDEGRDRLGVITALIHSVVIPLAQEHCVVVGGLARTLGIPTAQAVMEAGSNFVPIMTAHRYLVTRFLPKEWPIVDL